MGKVKDAVHRLITWKPDTKLVAFCFVGMLLLLLIPLFRIAFYAVPWYDDYNYGAFTKAALSQDPTIKGALQGALGCVKTQWYAWQGTFSSIFFMSLMPAVWGEDKYFLGPVFLILLLTAAVFVLVRVLVIDVLHADWASCVALQAVTAILVIVRIHTSQAGFFWYNAGVHYVGMHSFCILFTAAAIRLLQVKKIAAKLLLLVSGMAGALLVGGSNYVTSLQGGILILSLLAVGVLAYKKKALLLLPLLLVYAVSFYKNISAPGNQVRGASYVGWGLDPVHAVLSSFWEAARHIGEFSGWITLAVMLLLVPVIWQMAGRTNFTFRFPGLLLLWSFCLYATGFTPSLYSLGHAGLGRTLNAVKITYQLLLIINEVYCLGWLRGYLAKREKSIPNGKCYWWFYPLMGLFMLFIFSIEPNQAGTYSSYGAYYYIHTGEAYNFHQEYLERVKLLKGEENVVVVTPYHFKPWLLCVGDLSEDQQNEVNRSVAGWYGKEAVICSEE